MEKSPRVLVHHSDLIGNQELKQRLCGGLPERWIGANELTDRLCESLPCLTFMEILLL